jgi:hypothetical protein
MRKGWPRSHSSVIGPGPGLVNNPSPRDVEKLDAARPAATGAGQIMPINN